MRAVCHICGDTHIKGVRCPQNTSRVDEIHQSPAYKAARPVVFERDGYRCHFCNETCVPGDRLLKATAAHHPLGIDELIARGHDPTDPDTMVTACARCHGRVDGARSRQ